MTKDTRDTLSLFLSAVLVAGWAAYAIWTVVESRRGRLDARESIARLEQLGRAAGPPVARGGDGAAIVVPAPAPN